MPTTPDNDDTGDTLKQQRSELTPPSPGVALLVRVVRLVGLVSLGAVIVDGFTRIGIEPPGIAALKMTWASSLMLSRPAVHAPPGRSRAFTEYSLPTLAALLGVNHLAQYGWFGLNGVLAVAISSIGVLGLVRARRWIREYPSPPRHP